MKGTQAKELRKLESKELEKKLEEIQTALVSEKPSPKVRPLKKAIARIKTILTEKKGGVK